jgi:hypothetical protein
MYSIQPIQLKTGFLTNKMPARSYFLKKRLAIVPIFLLIEGGFI